MEREIKDTAHAWIAASYLIASYLMVCRLASVHGKDIILYARYLGRRKVKLEVVDLNLI